MTALRTAPSSKRQPRLPGIERKLDDATSWKRARRDFSAEEFDHALARNGFQALQGGLSFIDATGCTDRVFTAVMRKFPIRMHRRATLAKLLRGRSATARAAE